MITWSRSRSFAHASRDYRGFRRHSFDPWCRGRYVRANERFGRLRELQDVLCSSRAARLLINLFSLVKVRSETLFPIKDAIDHHTDVMHRQRGPRDCCLSPRARHAIFRMASLSCTRMTPRYSPRQTSTLFLWRQTDPPTPSTRCSGSWRKLTHRRLGGHPRQGRHCIWRHHRPGLGGQNAFGEHGVVSTEQPLKKSSPSS